MDEEKIFDFITFLLVVGVLCIMFGTAYNNIFITIVGILILIIYLILAITLL